jgi:glutamine synthetase
MKSDLQFPFFIGAQLTKVLEELEGVTKGKLSPEEKQI